MNKQVVLVNGVVRSVNVEYEILRHGTEMIAYREYLPDGTLGQMQHITAKSNLFETENKGGKRMNHNNVNQYVEMKQRHKSERNSIAYIIAIGKEALDEELADFGWNEQDVRPVYDPNLLGLYVHKDEHSNFQEMINRHSIEYEQNIANDLTGERFIYDMWNCELANHEYVVTGDFAPALEALGFEISDLHNNPALANGLQLASTHQMELYQEYDEMER